MVGHHLPVVFPSCFCVQNKHLVHVKRGLSDVIELDRAGERQVRIVYPNLRRVEGRSGKVEVHILLARSDKANELEDYETH